LYKKDHEQAIAEREKAVALDPNYADGLASLGEVLIWSGNHDDGIEFVKKAMRLDPHHHVWYLFVLGVGHIFSEQYEEAIKVLERGIIRNPDFIGTHFALAFVYSATGRIAEGRAEVKEILRISPDYSLKLLRDMIPIKDEGMVEMIAESLRKAGLK
jgi:adenylate cyclase